MDVSTIGGISNNGSPDPLTGQTLGKQDFLNLLLKQLSHQDPLNPMDSTEFTTQLSQFSSLEELTNINSALGDVLASQQSMQNASVANFIGKRVTTEGDTTYLKDTAEIQYELPQSAAKVSLSVIDNTGKLVFTEELGPQEAGNRKQIWNGEDNEGNPLPEGIYSVEVTAQDTAGESFEPVTNTSGIVTGVFFEENVTYLEIDGIGSINLNEIKSIG